MTKTELVVISVTFSPYRVKFGSILLTSLLMVYGWADGITAWFLHRRLGLPNPIKS